MQPSVLFIRVSFDCVSLTRAFRDEILPKKSWIVGFLRAGDYMDFQDIHPATAIKYVN
jgi:hypothetical protein